MYENAALGEPVVAYNMVKPRDGSAMAEFRDKQDCSTTVLRETREFECLLFVEGAGIPLKDGMLVLGGLPGEEVDSFTLENGVRGTPILVHTSLSSVPRRGESVDTVALLFKPNIVPYRFEPTFPENKSVSDSVNNREGIVNRHAIVVS